VKNIRDKVYGGLKRSAADRRFHRSVARRYPLTKLLAEAT